MRISSYLLFTCCNTSLNSSFILFMISVVPVKCWLFTNSLSNSFDAFSISKILHVTINSPCRIHQTRCTRYGELFSFLSYNGRAKWTDAYFLGLLRPSERHPSILPSITAFGFSRLSCNTLVSPNRLNRNGENDGHQIAN